MFFSFHQNFYIQLNTFITFNLSCLLNLPFFPLLVRFSFAASCTLWFLSPGRKFNLTTFFCLGVFYLTSISWSLLPKRNVCESAYVFFFFLSFFLSSPLTFYSWAFTTSSPLCFHSGSWDIVSLWDRLRERQSWTTHPQPPTHPAPTKTCIAKNVSWAPLLSPPESSTHPHTQQTCDLFKKICLPYCVSPVLIRAFWSDLGQRGAHNHGLLPDLHDQGVDQMRILQIAVGLLLIREKGFKLIWEQFFSGRSWGSVLLSALLQNGLLVREQQRKVSELVSVLYSSAYCQQAD